MAWPGDIEENRIICKPFNNTEGNSPVTLLKIEGDQKEKLLERLNLMTLEEESPIRKVSSSYMLPLISAAGFYVGSSAKLGSSLFMATTDPSNLMRIGGGVGSQFMSAGGKIMKQAPFVPAKLATFSISASLVAFQAMAIISIQNSFKVVNEKLDSIKNIITRMEKKDNAKEIGKLESAIKRISILEKQYAINHHFTNDMMVRLCLLENEINPMLEEYHWLYGSQKLNTEDVIHYVNGQQRDANILLAASIVDMQISLLLSKLHVQEQPNYIKISNDDFEQKINFYKNIWNTILVLPNKIKDMTEEIKESVKAMNGWQRNMPEWLGGKSRERKDLEYKAEYLSEQENELSEDSKIREEQIGNIKKSLKPTSSNQLLYFPDETGEYVCYSCTSDIQFKEPSK